MAKIGSCTGRAVTEFCVYRNGFNGILKLEKNAYTLVSLKDKEIFFVGIVAELTYQTADLHTVCLTTVCQMTLLM
jgi:hypothetical protein